MRLSWNEIRARAAVFAKEWETDGYEKGQTQLFYQGLFDVFGVPVKRVAAFEEPVKNLGAKRGFIDLFWKGMLASRHGSGESVRLLRTYGDHAARIDVSRRNGLRSTPSVGVQM